MDANPTKDAEGTEKRAKIHDWVNLRGSALIVTVMADPGDDRVFLILDTAATDNHSSTFSFRASPDGCVALAQSLLKAAALLDGTP